MELSTIISDILYPIYLSSTGISKDTRTIERGNVYFAITGESFDGNLFAKAALDAGASHAVVDNVQPELIGDHRIIQVDDALVALQQLATHHRRQLSTKIIGLTGSNGKTTTKELLYSILKSYNSNTYATAGNYNNFIGVPLTLLSIPIDAEYAIIEMGSNQPGDIKELCDITHPDYGLITNIGKTHLEKLISQKGVFKEKSALYKAVIETNGKFFVNNGDPYLKALTTNNTLSYNKEKTLRGTIEKKNSSTLLQFTYTQDGTAHTVDTYLFGAYNMENIAAAITVAEYFDIPANVISTAIASYTPSNMRSEVMNTGRNTIIMDAYNANPASMHNAVLEFAKITADRKIAFIGDMLELGKTSDQEHQDLIAICLNLQDTQVYFVGKEMKKNASHRVYADVQECINDIEKSNISNATVLLKGSRGVRLERLLPYL